MSLTRNIPIPYPRLLRRGTRRYLIRLDLKPAQTLAFSFAALIFFGAFLLMLPAATPPGHPISFLNALFTSTSAVCVTGLIVVDTATAFTPFGQWVILFLLQMGGIGIMTFTAVFAAIFSGGMGIRDRLVMQDVMDLGSMGEVGRLVKAVFKVTLGIEVLGAFFLYLFFLRHTENHSEAAYVALFHAVSAFCNAGFSTFSNSLMDFRMDIGINFVIIILVVCGGLGFPVIVNLKDYIFRKGQAAGVLSLHTKIMVTATLILISLGTVLILLTEWTGTLQNLPWWDAVLTALFHSIVARTAGFNTMDVSLISSATIVILALLMFIGGGPGSTAGGVKMPTMAILFSSARALFRGRETPELFHRSIPKGVMMKAVAIVSIAVAGLFWGTFLLSLTENAPLPQIFFESVSALGTVGLSMGLTPNLSPTGKIIVILMMFIGRIGPLSVVLAIGQRRKKGLYYYPEERVIMG